MKMKLRPLVERHAFVREMMPHLEQAGVAESEAREVATYLADRLEEPPEEWSDTWGRLAHGVGAKLRGRVAVGTIHRLADKATFFYFAKAYPELLGTSRLSVVAWLYALGCNVQTAAREANAA